MTSGKEKAYETASVSVSVSASASANGHDPSVCGDHGVYSSTTSDALNDELCERHCWEETVMEHGASMDTYLWQN